MAGYEGQRVKEALTVQFRRSVLLSISFSVFKVLSVIIYVKRILEILTKSSDQYNIL